MSRVLVTGGSGVLGRLVVERLTESGHSVRVLSRGPSGDAAPPWLPVPDPSHRPTSPRGWWLMSSMVGAGVSCRSRRPEGLLPRSAPARTSALTTPTVS